jgi:hypothetical protein
VWANVQVLESANAKASAIAVSFMVVSFVGQIRDNRTITNKTFVPFGYLPSYQPKSLLFKPKRVWNKIPNAIRIGIVAECTTASLDRRPARLSMRELRETFTARCNGPKSRAVPSDKFRQQVMVQQLLHLVQARRDWLRRYQQLTT